MELTGAEALIKKIDKKKIEELCRKHGIKLLVLHGSYAKNRATKKSDIDIGILSAQRMDHDKYLKIFGDFADVFGDKFDPVFLNGVEPMISFHTAMAGLPLYEAEKGDFMKYKVQTMGRYLDTKKFRALEKEYVQRAAK
jgi:predicted nucleotidyltransferase